MIKLHLPNIDETMQCVPQMPLVLVWDPYKRRQYFGPSRNWRVHGNYFTIVNKSNCKITTTCHTLGDAEHTMRWNPTGKGKLAVVFSLPCTPFTICGVQLLPRTVSAHQHSSANWCPHVTLPRGQIAEFLAGKESPVVDEHCRGIHTKPARRKPLFVFCLFACFWFVCCCCFKNDCMNYTTAYIISCTFDFNDL